MGVLIFQSDKRRHTHQTMGTPPLHTAVCYSVIYIVDVFVFVWLWNSSICFRYYLKRFRMYAFFCITYLIFITPIHILTGVRNLLIQSFSTQMITLEEQRFLVMNTIISEHLVFWN